MSYPGYGGPPGSVEKPGLLSEQKRRAQQRIYQEQERKKRSHSGMMQANEDRPRTGRGGFGPTPRDDSMRPLVSAPSTKNSQPDHAHGKYYQPNQTKGRQFACDLSFFLSQGKVLILLN